jgi:glycosyltransferase involved in cell wall biosynthesis
MIREQMLAHHTVDPTKIKVLYPPTDPVRFNRDHRDQKEELRERFGMGKDKTSFLIVSGNHQLKGLPLLLEVFSRLQDQPFELFVAGPQTVNSSLPNVRFLGFVKDTESLYTAADCTLLPSRYDAFGQVVTESLLCGTPVVVSTMTGASAIVTEKEGIVIDSFSPDAWEAAILSIPERVFNIAPDIALQRGLLFEDHMQRLVELADREGENAR